MSKQSEILNKSFSSYQEFDQYFKSIGINDYSIYQNSLNLKNKKGTRIGKIVLNNFKTFWQSQNIKRIFNKDKVNIIELLALNMSICFETGSTYKPISELGNLKYLFNDDGKQSYNTSQDLKQISAFKLFNDQEYISAHNNSLPRTLQKTTDTRWDSAEYPNNFDKKLSSNTGFIGNADFNKFRGRGLIQTTGRVNYTYLVDYIQDYKGNNTNILFYTRKWKNKSNKTVLSISTNDDWDTLFEKTNLEIAVEAVHIYFSKSRKVSSIQINPNQDQNSLNRDILEVGKSINGTLYGKQLLTNVNTILNDILKKQNAEPVSNDQVDASGDNPEINNQEQTSTRDYPDSTNSNIDTPIGAGLRNVFKRTIDLKNIISFDISKTDKNPEVTNTLGYIPFVWYNEYQIDINQISSFILKSDSLVPTIQMSFKDTFGLMNDTDIPLDDSKIIVYINSRIESVEDILMRFKISKYSSDGTVTYIEGIADLNQMLSKKQEYYKGTSFDSLQSIAKKSRLGFNTNCNSSNDSQYWLNPGDSTMNFVKHITDHSYISDNSFLWTYIDYYYNLNYVDVENALNLDLNTQKFQYYSDLNNLSNTTSSVELTDYFLANDNGFRDTNHFVEDIKIINNSTQISIDKGYLTKVGYYTKNEKEQNLFDVDTISSNGDKRIILKGNPDDSEYYNSNVRTIYGGKIDSDNMHKNYLYANVQNDININEISKIAIKCKLPTPNFNIVRFQKLKLLLNTPTPSLTDLNINMTRLSGEWLVIDIRFILSGGSFYQELMLMRRDLDLSPDEQLAIQNQKEEQANLTDAQSDNQLGVMITDIIPDDATSNDNPIENSDVSNFETESIETFSNSFVEELEDKNIVLNNDGSVNQEKSLEKQKKDNTFKTIKKKKNIPLTILNNALLGYAAIDYALETYDQIQSINLDKVPANFLKMLNPYENRNYQSSRLNTTSKPPQFQTGFSFVNSNNTKFSYRLKFNGYGDFDNFVLGKTGKSFSELYFSKAGRYNSFNDNLFNIFDSSDSNIVEIVTLNETLSQLQYSFKNTTDTSNVLELFTKNNNMYGNISAYDQLNDPEYYLKHVNSRLDLRETTNLEWDGQTYPLRNETNNSVLTGSDITSLDFFKFRTRSIGIKGRDMYRKVLVNIKYETTDIDKALTLITDQEINELFSKEYVQKASLKVYFESIGINNINTNRSENDIFKSVNNILDKTLPLEKRKVAFLNIKKVFDSLQK